MKEVGKEDKEKGQKSMNIECRASLRSTQIKYVQSMKRSDRGADHGEKRDSTGSVVIDGNEVDAESNARDKGREKRGSQ